MPANEANPIYPSEREHRDLEALVRQQTCAQHVALRARIVLLASEGVGIQLSATRHPRRYRWWPAYRSAGHHSQAFGDTVAYAREPTPPLVANRCAGDAMPARSSPWPARIRATAGGLSPIRPSGNWPPRRSNAASSPPFRSAMTFTRPIGSPPSGAATRIGCMR